ncbi:MAG: restriction endonuclease subunit S [Pseudomonadota bacterium]
MSWSWMTMGDVTDVIGGGTPSTSNPSSFEGSIPWITPADMAGYSGKTISGGSRCISEQGLNGSGARWLPKGSVLFSSRAPIGYVAIASGKLTTNQGFKSFVPSAGMNSEYLYYWLILAKRHAEALASGTTFLELSGAKAALIPLPIAPAVEQTRIVTKLEELLSDLDAGVAELKAAQKKLGQYRQSLLKAAVDGALTAEWRSRNAPTEAGAQLLDRILAERRASWEAKQLAKFDAQGKAPPKGWQSKYPEPVKPDVSGLPELPEGWVWACVEQLGNVQLGRQRSPDKLKGLNPVPYIRAANITEQGVDFSDVLKMDFSEKERETFQLISGDVLLTEASGSPQHVGRPVIWPHVDGLYCFQNTVIRFTPMGITSEFAFQLFLAWQKLGVFQRLSGGVGINHLSAGKFSALAVPLPPLTEQAALVGTLSMAFDSLAAQERAIEYSLKQSTAQRQNILRAAFSGQLVSQDPNDEPASVLLERIRTERTAQAAVKAPRRSKIKEFA